MRKANYLRSLTAVAAVTFVLAGCNGNGFNEPLPEQTQNVPERMKAVYDLAAGNIPIPNDLLFGGTTDLTLNIPVADSSDFSDPALALSSLDGWSSVAPFSISFSSLDDTLSVDASSVVAGSSVRLYKVNVLRPEVAPGILAPTGPVASVERELTPGVEYVTQAVSATSIAIIPTTPLTQQASYMVVLTNGLQDSDGEAILHDAPYAIAQSQTPIAAGSSVAALEPVRQLVNAMESAASTTQGGPARSSIILSFQFTVQSVGTVMNSAKLAYVDGPLAAGATPVTSFSSLFTDTTPFTQIGAADLYKGSIQLAYLLGVPSLDNPTAPLNTFWRALPQLPIGPGGSLVDNPFGDNLTYANSFPRANGSETVPLFVSMPKEAACPKPDDGYPVVIFQHGITGNRTNLLGIADSLAGAPSCQAAVAMDLPLHGIDANNPVHLGLNAASNGEIGLFEDYNAGGLRERTFGVDFVDNETGEPGPDGSADASGTHTINLANLLVARDNNRQAILDLLFLEKSIAFMDIDSDGNSDFDAGRISYIGHSLGGIVGTGVIANSDNIKAAALANPGGGIALMLNASQAFGDRIRTGIAAGAGLSVDDPALPAILNEFYFVAQTVLDSGDPINVAAGAVANNVPTLLLQVLDDSVVPNSVATAPLSGTEPLSRALGLTTVSSAGVQEGFFAGERLFTKLNQGLHSTVLSPADATGDPVGLLNVTTEMQTQIVSFLSTNGAGIVVTDPTLLDE